ncbi:MAG: MlaD family protein [Balneolaceae bacterium]|nr:MlaD family protein [Balneolaceae bacterium]
MKNLSNELKVALTILLSVAVAFVGFRMMSDLPVFRNSMVLYSHFQKVDGLSSGNYVYINGVKVGSVKKIELDPDDSVRVSMNFNTGIEIPEGSVAYLESSGLLDEKVILIERGDRGNSIPNGGRIQGVYRGGMMETLANEGEKLSADVSQSFEKLNLFLEQANSAVDSTNRGRLRASLSHVETALHELSGLIENKRSDLERTVESASRFMASMDTIAADNSTEIDSLLRGMNRSVRELEALSSDLGETNRQLNTLLGRINSGEGTLGRLVNDPTLYDNLEQLSAELRTLVRNINEDPGRYLKHMRLIEVF